MAEPIALYTLPGDWGTRSVSPFCTKLEGWLLLTGVPYTLHRANPVQAPKGKVPYIRDGDLWLGDSQLVIRHLERTRGVSLDAHLSSHEAAVAHIVRRTIEEATYFHGVWLRWGRDEAWPTQRATFAALLPPVIRWFGPAWIRRGLRRTVYAQGTGRHAPAEIEALAIADLDAFAGVLGTSAFLGGARPCTADVVLFAFADGILRYPVDSSVRRHLAASTPLVAHRDRMAEHLPWPATPWAAALTG